MYNKTKVMTYMDKEVRNLIDLELKRQNEGIELIASENYASKEVRDMMASILTNKYAEGYPGKRYYGGCEYVDAVEQLAIDRACQLFGSKFANVQPHSGSQANAAAYRALLPDGGKILSLVLNDGGHLTHGSPVSFSSHLYSFVHYPLNNGHLDYDNIEELAIKEKPDLILAGYSAYPYAIDFKRFKEIADKVGAYFMVDMAHIAGLVATGEHMSPVPYADIVTTTTHKTLRGPRGGMILTNDEALAKKINSSVFPGCQGGPLEHVIAGKAVAFKEALQPEFKDYAKQIVKNCKALADEMTKLGYKLVSGGTDNHLILVDIYGSVGITGKKAERILHDVNITTNKNAIPNDTQKPTVTSGLRLGTAAVTTRGFNEEDMRKVANWIDRALRNADNEEELLKVQNEVKELMGKHPYL